MADSLYFYSNGSPNRAANQFLRDLFSNYMAEIETFAVKYGDYIHSYNERQQASALVPALREISKGVFVEQPVKRKTRGVEVAPHGWVDYWVETNNRYVYLIEHKHSYFNLSNQHLNSTILYNHEVMIEQLKKLNSKQIRDNLNTAFKNKQVYKLGLHTMYGYEKAYDETAFQFRKKDEVLSSLKKMLPFESLDYHYAGIGHVSRKHAFDSDSNKLIHFPAALFLANIQKVKI